jgi:uncharacterized protein
MCRHASVESSAAATFQSTFHQRWGHLDDPHVRALAWLLDAPDLLDADAACWQGRIATLGPLEQGARDWLADLERNPAALHASLSLQRLTRLGRYAEQLMAFYFRHQGILQAHGVQVRAGKNETVGEFDFLLRQDGSLLHWEFAAKFYLLALGGEAVGAGHEADYFIGPNLADTLGAKMRKIFDRQLALSRHPAAQIHLPQPVVAAQALVKGWLFYRLGEPPGSQPAGVSAAHCQGFWCTLSELGQVAAARFVILPRLEWLAPAKARADASLDRQQVEQQLTAHFANSSMPVLVAALQESNGCWLETARGFIVPDDWRSRAGQRVRQAPEQGV